MSENLKQCDGCELDREYCPDQRDLRGGSQYPGMPCPEIAKGLAMMQRRVEGNSDCSSLGLSPLEQEAEKLYRTSGVISLTTVVELKVNE